MDRVEKAMENHRKGYNCCQAVVCAFGDTQEMNEDILFKAAEGFGLGMGNMECTCGAVSGAVMLCGMKNSTANLEKPDSKKETYKLSKEVIEAFKEQVGSVICQDIKGVKTGKILSSCDRCIEQAVRITEEKLGL